MNLEDAPVGLSPATDLSSGGWYATQPDGRQFQIPVNDNSWQTSPARFIKTYIHPWSGKPTIDGAQGQYMGVYSETLRAQPKPDIPYSRPDDEMGKYFSPDAYFHGGVQRALWNLGDYGVAADVFHLYSLPVRERTLYDQELQVMRMEGFVKNEREHINQEKQNLLWDKANAKQRLREARVLERIHPYIKRDGSRRERQIQPLQTRAEKNRLLNARRGREARYVCPLCHEP